MADEEVRITLRLPAGLRDKLAESAENSARSMNGEILARLEGSFSGVATRLDRENQRLSSRLENIERNLKRLANSVANEIDRQRFIQADPERRSPSLVADKEGRDAFKASSSGAYSNPYPPDHIFHLDYRRGFKFAAVNHFSEEGARERYPELWQYPSAEDRD